MKTITERFEVDVGEAEMAFYERNGYLATSALPRTKSSSGAHRLRRSISRSRTTASSTACSI
jgi:hypothetical protein